MSLAILANVPDTPEAMAEWSFAHMAHHRDMVTKIYQLYNINLPIYALDPVNLDDPTNFIDTHQVMHNDIDGLVNLPPYDLTGVDLTNFEQRESWIWLNFQSHLAESQALGVY
jgi:hypothetical protein